MGRLILFVVSSALLVGACQTPAARLSPTPPATAAPQTGILAGHVTIGPLMPVERVGQPTPAPPPETYTARGLVITRAGGYATPVSVPFNPDGSYRLELEPGQYVVDIKPLGMDSAAGLPAIVTIRAGQTVTLDIEIDTGIR